MDFKAQNLSENSRETQCSTNMILKETAGRDWIFLGEATTKLSTGCHIGV